MQVFESKNPKNPSEHLRYLPDQDAFRFSESKITGYFGGWGAGKSIGLLGFIEVSMACNPGCTGLILEPEYKMLRDFINNKFRPAFRHLITGESKQDNTIFLKRGIKVVYLSGHNVDTLEQYEAAWLAADEVGLMKSELLPRSVARVREPSARRPRIGFAGTPHWGWLSEAFDGRQDDKRRCIHVSTNDNPFTSDEYKENLYESCPATMVQAYIHGHFVAPGGSVYPEFDELTHVIPWAYDRNLQTGCSIDWSPRTPHVLIVQMLPKGYPLPDGRLMDRPGMVVIDEFFPDGSLAAVRTDTLCQGIKAMGYRLDFACADPAGESAEATSGMDNIRIAQEVLGIKIKFTRNPRLRSIKNGILHVARMLRPMTGNPSLYFAEKLNKEKRPRGVCKSIRAYSYSKTEDGKPIDDNPVKDGITDHSMDDLRYLAINYFPVLRLQPGITQYA